MKYKAYGFFILIFPDSSTEVTRGSIKWHEIAHKTRNQASSCHLGVSSMASWHTTFTGSNSFKTAQTFAISCVKTTGMYNGLLKECRKYVMCNILVCLKW